MVAVCRLVAIVLLLIASSAPAPDAVTLTTADVLNVSGTEADIYYVPGNRTRVLRVPRSTPSADSQTATAEKLRILALCGGPSYHATVNVTRPNGSAGIGFEMTYLAGPVVRLIDAASDAEAAAMREIMLRAAEHGAVLNDAQFVRVTHQDGRVTLHPVDPGVGMVHGLTPTDANRQALRRFNEVNEQRTRGCVSAINEIGRALAP